jgi:hypothetical protein
MGAGVELSTFSPGCTRTGRKGSCAAGLKLRTDAFRRQPEHEPADHGRLPELVVALKVLTALDKTTIMSQFIDGGPSTCVLRTCFGDADCSSMFFDEDGSLRTQQFYLEIGRQALRALLDPDRQEIDRLRYQIVDDKLWPAALARGANVNLGSLVGLSTADNRVEYLIGDVVVITHWAQVMAEVGVLIEDVRANVGASDPASLVHNNQFKQKREALQKKLAAMLKASKTRFDEPWGMVCLFWASGSPRTASAKTVARRLLLARGAQAVAPASPQQPS